MFGAIGRFVRRHGTWILVLCLAAAAPLLLASLRLHLEMDVAEFFPSRDPYFVDYKYFADNFGVSDVLVLVVRSETRDVSQEADALAAWMAKSPDFSWMTRTDLPDPRGGALFVAMPNKPCTDLAFCRTMLTELRRYRDETKTPMEWTGGAASAIEATDALRRDIRRSSVLAFLLILGILFVTFGDPLLPVVAVVPLGIGVACALGFAELVFGRINLVTAALPTALLGIGIDYALHLSSTRHTLTEHNPAAAWGKVFERVAPPLCIGALTTLAACFALVVARLRGFSQLGYVGAVGLAATFLASILTMPLLLDVRDRFGVRRQPLKMRWLQGMTELVVRHRFFTISCFLLVTAPLLLAAFRMKSERNPRGYQDPSLPSIRLYKELSGELNLTFQPVLLATPSLEAERRVLDRIKPLVGPAQAFSLVDSLEVRLRRHAPNPQIKRFVGKDRQLCMMLYPRLNPYEDSNLEALVGVMDDVLRRCGDDVVAYSGGPIIYERMLALTRQDLQRTGAVAAIAVILTLVVLVRRPRYFVPALVPMAGGFVWMLGIMQLVGCKFTLANSVAMPLVIGLGIDYGVHIVHRLRDDSLSSAVATAGRAILASATTTAAAFLALCTSGNKGMVSMGVAGGTGILSCLLWSLFFLPALMPPGRAGAGGPATSGSSPEQPGQPESAP